MSNQHYFDVPFAFGGDVTAIPDALQTGGTVSMEEGWNYNYQRNLSTDSAALPIDRSTTNWLFLQITTALQALQAETIPEWITAAQNGGASLPYGLGAEVLYSTSGNAPFVKYVSLVTGNTSTPGTDANWQVAVDAVATGAQAAAGTNNSTIMTPALVASLVAARALLAGNSTQVFNAGPASSPTNVVTLSQFIASLTSSGSFTFPNGLILKWGTVATSTGATVPFSGLITFVEPFPNGLLQGFACDSGSSLYTYGVVLSSKTQMTVWGSSQVGTARWFAFGF